MFTLEAKRLKIRPETHFLTIFGQKSFYTVTWLLSMLETWFWCQNKCFGENRPRFVKEEVWPRIIHHWWLNRLKYLPVTNNLGLILKIANNGNMLQMMMMSDLLGKNKFAPPPRLARVNVTELLVEFVLRIIYQWWIFPSDSNIPPRDG